MNELVFSGNIDPIANLKIGYCTVLVYVDYPDILI